MNSESPNPRWLERMENLKIISNINEEVSQEQSFSCELLNLEDDWNIKNPKGKFALNKKQKISNSKKN